MSLNTIDGCIPSDLGVGSTPEIEEERRLLYVAMTRAKDQLHLMVPQRFFTTDNGASATGTSTRSARASFQTASPGIPRAATGPAETGGRQRTCGAGTDRREG
jgi:superfamily I DNA/RNA helicase